MSDDASLSASKALLGAALGGLLSLASVTCATSDAGTSSAGGAGGASASSSSNLGGAGSTSNSTASTGHASSSAHAVSSSASASAGDGTGATGGSTASSGGAGGETAASGGGGGGASTASSGGAPLNGDTPFPDTTCDGGVSADPAVTSSTMEVLTQQQFEDMCSARDGIFEIQPHCGGSNACRGFSYDSGTELLTEHTCRATNQCAGWSCVICS